MITGISRPVYTEEQLQEMKRKSNNEKIDIDGKKYTRYECTQLQRQIETKIRKLKDRKEILKAAGDDVGVRECNRKIRLLKEKYNEITLKAGLDAHYDRMSVVKSGKTVDFDPLSAIIKREKFSAYERIESGELPLTLNSGNQNKHIQSSHSFKPEEKKSILYGDLQTAQKLVDKYHGKGKLKFTANGKWTNKELVTTTSDIGIVFDPETGEAKTTNRFAIHYGKKGTHVVPIKREDKKLKLHEYSGKKVKITTFDGKEFSGIACDFIPAQDNIPEIASISIDEIEFYENEIKSITITD